MKNILPKIASNYLILLTIFGLSASFKGYSRSPAVLPVRGLEMPDANKKYLNGPPDLQKTTFKFDRGTPKVLVHPTLEIASIHNANNRTITILIAFAGAFSLLSPVIYLLFFRKKPMAQSIQSGAVTAKVLNDTHLNNVSPIRTTNEKEKEVDIRKVS